MKQQEALAVAIIAACGLFSGLPLLAQEPSVATPAPAERLEELETVVVYGGYAIPQMWKISKDGHVLWLLVIDKPAPAGVQWRSKQLETRVAESQLVLYATENAGYRITDSSSSRAAEQRERERKEALYLPGKETLKDVLPPEAYARWRVLKSTYIGSDDAIERRCPSCAMKELERMVEKTMPPPPPIGPSLQPLVDKAARKHRVKVRTLPDVTGRVELTQTELDMAHIGSLLDMGDVTCFTRRLDDLERLIKYRDQQDIANLRVALRGNSAPSCLGDSEDWITRWLPSGKLPDPAAAQSMSEKLSLQRKLNRQKVDAEWMAAAQAALAKNRSTFAVQRIWNGEWSSQVSGHIAQFRKLGYEVEEPSVVVE